MEAPVISPPAASGAWRAVTRLALPLMLSLAATQLQQAIDRAFLAQLSPEALAASFPAGFSAYLLQCLFFAACSYVASFVAQHHGSGERHLIGGIIWPALGIAAIGGLAVFACVPALPTLLQLYSDDAATHALMSELAFWYCAATFPSACFLVATGVMAGLDRAWLVVVLQTVAMLINVLANYLLIFGHAGLPAFGPSGAAIGTFLAQSLIAVVALAWLWSRPMRERFGTWGEWRRGLRCWRRYLRHALPIGMREFAEVFGWQVVIMGIGQLGTIALAANNIAIGLNMLAFVPLLGTVQAISVLVGQAIGAEDLSRARAIARAGIGFSTIYTGLWCIAFALIPDLLIGLFIDSGSNAKDWQAIYDLARICLWINIVWTLSDGIHFAIRGVLFGAGDTLWPLVTLIATSLLGLIPATLAAIYWQDMLTAAGWHPLIALWAAIAVSLVLLTVLFIRRYRAGHWLSRSLRDPVAEPDSRA